jgi:hypothetical protein
VFVVPGAICVINMEETLGRGWRRLLVGIGVVGDRYDKATIQEAYVWANFRKFGADFFKPSQQAWAYVYHQAS